MTKNTLGLESLETRETPSRGFAPGFAFTPSAINFVSGAVFADANGNGARDAGENGVNGVRVFVDVNDNGVRDANEPTAVTQSNQRVSFQGNQVVTTDQPGSFLINSVVNRSTRVGGAVRVELPDGATLTTAVPVASASNNPLPVAIGLQGVTGTPDTVTTRPISTSPIALPPSGGSGGSSSGSGSSSSFVSSVAFVGPNGQAFASTTGSVSGNGTAFGSATAVGANGTITSIFVGP